MYDFVNPFIWTENRMKAQVYSTGIKRNHINSTILWASATPQATWGFTMHGRESLALDSLCLKSGSSKSSTCKVLVPDVN